MNRNSFSAFFFIKRTKLQDNGEASICLRIKVNGSYVESQIKRSVRPDLWHQPTESCKGRDRKSIETNEYIRMLKLKVLTIHRELELTGAHFTARLSCAGRNKNRPVPNKTWTEITTTEIKGKHNDHRSANHLNQRGEHTNKENNMLNWEANAFIPLNIQVKNRRRMIYDMLNIDY